MRKSKQLLISFLFGSASFITAQTTVNVKVNTALDDHEERILGALPQTGTAGNMYPGSTGLELGSFNATTDPILVGLRFTNVTVPKFATIMDAYIQFTVKGTSKNTDPCNLLIYAENNANPATFSDNAMSLSSRSFTTGGAITWNVSGASWATIGSAGADQRTPNIKTLITPLVFKSNWASGNAMAFFIKGPGTREVESFEGDAAKAPELVITYSVAGTGTITTSIQELAKASAINVYPNPFKGSFNVSVELSHPSDVSISLYDLTGKLVEEKIIKQADKGLLQYTSVSALQAGIYFVKVQTNQKQEVIKLISE